MVYSTKLSIFRSVIIALNVRELVINRLEETGMKQIVVYFELLFRSPRGMTGTNDRNPQSK